MITLSGKMLTQLELIDIVFKYADAIKDEDKHKHMTYIHVLEILKNIPEEQRWPEQMDLKFIRVCLLEKGVGKISEIKEYKKGPEKPPPHLYTAAEEQRLLDERENCPQCQLGGGGCPRHRRPH